VCHLVHTERGAGTCRNGVGARFGRDYIPNKRFQSKKPKKIRPESNIKRFPPKKSTNGAVPCGVFSIKN
jgi:hypothetical protein